MRAFPRRWGVPFAIVRPLRSKTLGHQRRVTALFIRNALNGQRSRARRQRRQPLLHVREACARLFLAATHPAAANETFNSVRAKDGPSTSSGRDPGASGLTSKSRASQWTSTVRSAVR